ncbi:MAG: L,D-transpeptidase family protein [Hyphomicrobiaceae bacterium]
MRTSTVVAVAAVLIAAGWPQASVRAADGEGAKATGRVEGEVTPSSTAPMPGDPVAPQVAPAAPAVPASAAAPSAPAVTTGGPVSPVTPQAPQAPSSPFAADLEKALEGIGAKVRASAAGDDQRAASGILTDDFDALSAFYAQRAHAPLWVDGNGLTPRGRALMAAMQAAAEYGLDPSALDVPEARDGLAPADLAALDANLTVAAINYARHARGARIPEPAEMLNSNLDRKPQLHDTKRVLERLEAATEADIAATMAALHPVHPQFERLRQAFLKASGDGKGGGRLSKEAKRLRANMEFWRWMWDDLGDLYVFNNIPEFMQYVVHNGEIVRSDRIVVGEIGKQSSVFSRPLRSVVLRPRWRVPESIMVHELWPSLLRGGGLMRKYGLEITTKSGESRDWRAIDWSKDDIRNYHVWQPPGRRSVLGFVKFVFPSQHTIFMHDTPDKWMFNSRQRTHSHGCLRVRNPIELTEIVLKHDKGWDADKVKDLVDRGPLDNEVEMEKHIPIHLAYFTAWVDDDGKVRFFRDIYGHEKRVTLALDGAWRKIDKGRNHLAPAKPSFDPDRIARSGTEERRQSQGRNALEIMSEALGWSF